MHVIVFTTWNCKERSCQTKDIFSIKKLVRSDGCDSKPGKIKKMFTIMASTSRASRKTVEDAEIFQVLEESTDSDLRKMVVMNPTVTKMDNWMTILRQIKKEALVLT